MNRYIRAWNLKPSQIQKLLQYGTWSEHEKLLLENTFLNRLKQMYDIAREKIKGSRAIESETEDEKKNWTILKNMTTERLNKDPEKIPAGSVYLQRAKYDDLILIFRPESKEWFLFTRQLNELSKNPLFRSDHLLGLFGFIMENGLYNRNTASITVKSDSQLFRSSAEPVDPDKLYLDFMPLKPLGDLSFESGPSWKKICLLLVYDHTAAGDMMIKAEILASNTWGELYLSWIDLGSIHDETARCSAIGKQVNRFTHSASRLNVFQFSMAHDPDIVYKIKQSMEYQLTINQKTQGLQSRRPYLDRL